MKKIRKVKNKLKKLYMHIAYKNNKVKFIKEQYKLQTGKELNLDNPKSFNEKINWIKAYYYDPLYEKCSDKIEVRKYVKEKGLSEILTKIYGVYSDVDDINFNSLPKSFVLKTTHSSGGVAVVYDKNIIDESKIKSILKKSMKGNLYNTNREWQYKNLKPRIIAEELIKTKKKQLIDYKFFCFNGKVEYVYVAQGTTSGDESYYMDFFDKNFNWINVSRIGHKNYGPCEKPKKFDEMVKIAEKLSKDFAHVRVDLYNEEDKIYFGELTFTTAAGYGTFNPEGFDYELGAKFSINKLKNKMKGN